jgi:hypothetical protein
MSKLVLAVSAALALAFSVGEAQAWFRAGGFHYGGGWGHFGGVYHGAYGGFYHGGVVHAGGAYHTGTWGAYYHSPVVVNHYGCVACGYHPGWGYAGAAAAGVLAGAAIGAAATSAAVAASAWPVGVTYGYLPSGCTYAYTAGAAYYRCPAGWLKPAYGANGVYYTVVPAP